MAAPAIQISYNDKEIRVFWDQDTSGSYASFNLYWSADSGMAGEATVQTYIPNVPDRYYSRSQIMFKFKREDIGLTDDDVFYMRLKGVSAAGVEDAVNVGPIKYIPSLPEQISNYRGTQIHGFDYTNKMWRKVSVDSDGTLTP